MNERSQKIFERWQQFSLIEQLAHIGSEIARACHWQRKDEKLFRHSTERALELFDFTLEDPRWRSPERHGGLGRRSPALRGEGGRLREIARAREVFCDALMGGEAYGSSLDDLYRYFLFFAYAARGDKNKST